jgi:hypothetical protein
VFSCLVNEGYNLNLYEFKTFGLSIFIYLLYPKLHLKWIFFGGGVRCSCVGFYLFIYIFGVVVVLYLLIIFS